MAEIEKVKLPNDDTIYDIKDAKAIRGLASGTTSGHVLQFGTDGYTVSDSGKSMSDKQDTIDSSHKLSADLVDNSTPTFATATQGGKADTAVQTIKVNSASTGVTKTGDTVDITAIPASIVSAGALVNGMTATTQSTSDDSIKLATTAFVHDVVDELPEPMIFKSGMTLTADSTDTTKCAITVTDPASASDIKVGYTYKVTNISGTYTGTIKVGDTLIAKKNAPKVDKTWVVDTDWTVVPSGDETGYVVGKASGTTQNNLVKWGADGYTVDDSGIAVETSFSGTSDAKVPTSKSIKTNVADNAVLTGFTPVVTPSAIQNVASTDTITDAMEKLDNNTRLNESNISSFHKASGTDVYYQETKPTGTISVGSYWISKSGNKVYTTTANLYTGLNETTGKIFGQSGELNPNDNYNVSDYIEIDDTKDIVFSFNNTLQTPTRQQYLVVWYNSSYNIVSVAPIVVINDAKKYIFAYASVSGAKYVRINYRVSDTDVTVVQTTWE